MVAMVTPMEPGGAIDLDATRRLIEFHIDNHTDVIVAVGTTGESATLDEEEHCAFIREVVKSVRGRIPVIGGTGANATTEAIRLTRCAKDAGVDACLLVTPYYNKPTQHGLFEHFKAVAEAVDIPQILYNVPGRTSCDMLPDTVQRLSEIPNIIGLKEATGDLERIKELVARCGDDFVVLSGEDWLSAESMLAGGGGVISVTANVAPALMHDMCAAALARDRARTQELDVLLAPLHKALFLESNPIPVKWALKEMGLIGAGIRLPLTPLSERFHGQVREAMNTAAADTVN